MVVNIPISILSANLLWEIAPKNLKKNNISDTHKGYYYNIGNMILIS